ncbi:MAG: hypothetical protein CXT78_10725, partial [Thaumarchaeota archaeon]
MLSALLLFTLIGSMTLVPAFAQSTPAPVDPAPIDNGFSVSLNSPSSTNIDISGTSDSTSNDVILQVFAPNGNLVTIDQIAVTDGVFQTSLTTGGSLWNQDGVYSISIKQGIDYTLEIPINIISGVTADTSISKVLPSVIPVTPIESILVPTLEPTPQSVTQSDIIVSLLEQSSNQVNQQINQSVLAGISIPVTLDTAFDAGLSKHITSLEFIENGDLENGRITALEALSLFEDTLEKLSLLENNPQNNNVIHEINNQVKDIVDLKNDAEKIRNLIQTNTLDITLEQYDSMIISAQQSLANGDLLKSKQQIDAADDLLDDLFDNIEDKAEQQEEKEKRFNKFVEDTVEDLEDIINDADKLGLSLSIIASLNAVIAELQSAENISNIVDVTNDEGTLGDFFDDNPALIPDDDDQREDAIDEMDDALKEIKKAEAKISQSSIDGKIVEVSKQVLGDSRQMMDKSEQAFTAGLFDDAEDLAEDAKDLAKEARMKFLGKSFDDLDDERDEDDRNEREEDHDDRNEKDDDHDRNELDDNND